MVYVQQDHTFNVGQELHIYVKCVSGLNLSSSTGPVAGGKILLKLPCKQDGPCLRLALHEPHLLAVEMIWEKVSRELSQVRQRLRMIIYHPLFCLIPLSVITDKWIQRWRENPLLIYAEFDLMRAEQARVFTTSWHTRVAHRTMGAQSIHRVCDVSEPHTQSNGPALITKCHFGGACFISYINYRASLHFCTSRRERAQAGFFRSLPHQEPINSMQLQNSWWHLDHASLLLSCVCIIKIRCSNYLSLQ